MFDPSQNSVPEPPGLHAAETQLQSQRHAPQFLARPFPPHYPILRMPGPNQNVRHFVRHHMPQNKFWPMFVRRQLLHSKIKDRQFARRLRLGTRLSEAQRFIRRGQPHCHTAGQKPQHQIACSHIGGTRRVCPAERSAVHPDDSYARFLKYCVSYFLCAGQHRSVDLGVVINPKSKLCIRAWNLAPSDRRSLGLAPAPSTRRVPSESPCGQYSAHHQDRCRHQPPVQ